MTNTAATFAKETDLCSTFLECLPDGWTPYPETGGFDILLVRDEDGFQIGIEAKLRLNAKVVDQVIEGISYRAAAAPGPDCRAVLVPSNATANLHNICDALGVTVIRLRCDIQRTDGKIDRWGNMVRIGEGSHSYAFSPQLPRLGDHDWLTDGWFERCPALRVDLPDWVPDVVAGDKSPVSLTAWKVKAIKIVITLQKRGYVTRKDFKHFEISMSIWSQSSWLVRDGNGGWIAGPNMPDLRGQHPVNFAEIEADYEKWKAEANCAEPDMFVGGLS